MASFDCREAESRLQDLICADKELMHLDHQTSEAFQVKLRKLDWGGRFLLIPNQRQWLQKRAELCKLGVARLGDSRPDVAQINCLGGLYRSRLDELRGWQIPKARPLVDGRAYPLSGYVEFRVVDARDSGICGEFASRLNASIADGVGLESLQTGSTHLIATSKSSGVGSFAGHRYELETHDAGPFAGYQRRARALRVDGQSRIGDMTLGEWIAQLPNAGGRFSNISSQTRDYASIDVFRSGQRNYALVLESWGYFSPAAHGESAYAGLYDVNDSNAVPVCLYQTYQAPPVRNHLEKLAAWGELLNTLAVISGDTVSLLAQDERRDESLLRRESEWMLLNMPEVVLADMERYGHNRALLQRHDAALEAIFMWSERNVPSKQHYRRLIPLMQPAKAELVSTFVQVLGMKRHVALAAADLLMIDAIDRSVEMLLVDGVATISPLPTLANYVPRFSAVPTPGEIERGRRLGNLHSALLNRAGPKVVVDFMKYEFMVPNRQAGSGPSGDTALMAAVRTPEIIPTLISAGFDVNANNDWKKTALMSAAQANQLESLRLLLDAGADVNAATITWYQFGAGGLDNEEGSVANRTALMYAAANASPEAVQLLLAHGASSVTRDSHGFTACNYLMRNEQLSGPNKLLLNGLLCGVR
ncbi:MAG: ankyrin repeat domain-containing protein [Rhodocyclaceae bacterium]|nr:ankyrin repeat domain-containing protein [Rhodocyclaceae bacterium]